MADEKQHDHDSVEAVTERNVAGMRELLARKQQQQQAHRTEPPLEDDPNEPSQENDLANSPSGDNGSTGGIRNMGGGRP